jgi:preprotein translocase subunit SecD
MRYRFCVTLVGIGMLACNASQGRPSTVVPPVSVATTPDTSEASPLIEFRAVSDAPAVALVERTYAGEILYLEPQPLISDPDLLAVRPDVRGDRLIFSFDLTPEGERRLRLNTEQIIGGRIALLLESQVVNVFVVRSPLGPRGVAEGKLPRAEANRLALRIRALWPDRTSQSGNRARLM